MRQLARTPRPLAGRIRDAMAAIAADPGVRHASVRPLRGRDGFRLRIGGGRVVYEVRDDELLVLVLTIGSRGQVYR